MSRLERKRWQMGHALWPSLQQFLSSRLTTSLFGEIKALKIDIEKALAELTLQQRSNIASECWDFLRSFKDRHDDREFLRNGFGVSGTLKTDDGGWGQVDLTRLKLVYNTFVASLRAEEEDWHPRVGTAQGQ